MSRGKYENLSLLNNGSKSNTACYSSSEDVSTENEISTELRKKVNLVDAGGNTSEDEQNSKLLYSHQKVFKASTNTSNFIQKTLFNYQATTTTTTTNQIIPRFVDECEYRMNNANRGYAIIINNKKFHPSLEMPIRQGTDKDAVSLEKTFTKLGFTVRLEHNKSAQDINEILGKYAKADHSQKDAFVCCLLSHGEEGVIYGTDQPIEIQSIIQPFKLNRTLAGKPKMFFIQACRGTKLMDGIDTNPYKVQCVNKIPMEADFLIAYSTVSGYYSWRNSSNGSWFIQSLCDVFNLNAHKMEIMQLMTHVNRKVAYFYESNANDASMSGKKQVPCIVSMLTKELFFRSKNQQSDV